MIVSAVRAIGHRSNNAELILDCARLGYLPADARTLDPTYGRGRFWKLWRPDELVGCDLNPALSPCGHSHDVRALPFARRMFGAVVLDPPYKLNGTSTGRGPSASDADYGVELYRSRDDRHGMIRDGITECARLVARGGHLLVKCQDQVSGGRKRWQTREFADHAEQLGLRLVDMLHLPGYRAQPPGRRQEHAHTDYSTMLVLRREAP